jgi:hypothetical protein
VTRIDPDPIDFIRFTDRVRVPGRGVFMKAYTMTSGIIFALLAVAHVLRVMAEGPHLIAEPFFILTTAAAIGMSVWAWRVMPS